MRKSETTTINIFLLLLSDIEKFIYFTILYIKTYLEKLSLLHLCYSYFGWQVIGNAVMKYQHPYRYALVLYKPYFDPKYLAMD